MTAAQKAFYKKEFWKNVRSLHRMASAWIVTLASLGAAYWLQLSPEEQKAILEAHPFLTKAAPFITAAAWMYARAKPQKSLTPPPAETEGDQ